MMDILKEMKHKCKCIVAKAERESLCMWNTLSSPCTGSTTNSSNETELWDNEI